MDVAGRSPSALPSAWSRALRKDDPEGYVRTTMVRPHISRRRRLRRERLVGEVPDRGYADEALATAEGRRPHHREVRRPRSA